MRNEVQLFPYQRDGRDFLASRQFALLADTMGLGKSGQAVAACDAVQADTILVVCPASVRFNWDREFERFSARVRSSKIILTGTDEVLPCGITICSYDLAAKPEMLARLTGQSWDVVILDESHFLKSLDAKRAKAVLGKGGIVHKAKRAWLLSGTPTPNHPGELWVYLYTLFPETINYMKYDAFIDKYCTYYDGTFGRKITGGKNLPDLKKRIDPIILRRRKEDVLKDLPPITWSELVLDPADCNEEWLAKLLEAEMSEEGDLLKGILDKSLDGTDIDLSTLKIATLRRLTGMAKADAVAKHVASMLDGGIGKVVVFGIHRDPLKRLRDKLKKYHPHLVFGGMDAEKKETKIQSFLSCYKHRVFIANMGAAGTGIDGLQFGASDVLFFESSWTPAENLQAAMRVHRIGQEKPVTVRFISLANSLDEHVQRVIKRKTETLQQLFE